MLSSFIAALKKHIRIRPKQKDNSSYCISLNAFNNSDPNKKYIHFMLDKDKLTDEEITDNMNKSIINDESLKTI